MSSGAKRADPNKYHIVLTPTQYGDLRAVMNAVGRGTATRALMSGNPARQIEALERLADLTIALGFADDPLEESGSA